ncbi:MAG: NdvB protein, partial [Myxococcota bacterium]
MRLCLPTKDAVEMWELRVRNLGFHPRRLSLYPYFSVGYMSWMNQSAEYVPELGAIVARSVTPYQRLEDYPRVRALKDLTFLAAEELPDAWETSAPRFEGEGGLHCPEGIAQEHLSRQRNAYDLPVAVLQYRRELPPGATTTWRLLFGPARRDDEIRELRQRYLSAPGFERARREMETYSAPARAGVLASSPVPRLDHFVNDWLSPQIFYHGRVNRLTTDPQTRNYLQDAMGRVYLEPQGTRAALLFALGQQRPDGGMPDGILLRADAELKYINKVPHTDHCVWLPLVMQVYLDETGDWGLLREMVTDTQAGTELTVLARVGQAMRWLMRNRDHRGLSYIAQGDWCDPMNMVGPKGLGVSGWLTMA